jgi:hypothetical protein
MNTHRYLRAYMAGIVVPTVIYFFLLIVCVVAPIVYQTPFPLEQWMLFPIALVPSLWGLWNMLYARLCTGRYLSLGLHGAILPLILLPLGFSGVIALRSLSISTRGLIAFDEITIPVTMLVLCFASIIIIYYLMWKYLIGFFNRMLDIK